MATINTREKCRCFHIYADGSVVPGSGAAEDPYVHESIVADCIIHGNTGDQIPPDSDRCAVLPLGIRCIIQNGQEVDIVDGCAQVNVPITDAFFRGEELPDNAPSPPQYPEEILENTDIKFFPDADLVPGTPTIYEADNVTHHPNSTLRFPGLYTGERDRNSGILINQTALTAFPSQVIIPGSSKARNVTATLDFGIGSFAGTGSPAQAGIATPGQQLDMEIFLTIRPQFGGGAGTIVGGPYYISWSPHIDFLRNVNQYSFHAGFIMPSGNTPYFIEWNYVTNRNFTDAEWRMVFMKIRQSFVHN